MLSSAMHRLLLFDLQHGASSNCQSANVGQVRPGFSAYQPPGSAAPAPAEQPAASPTPAAQPAAQAAQPAAAASAAASAKALAAAEAPAFGRQRGRQRQPADARQPEARPPASPPAGGWTALIADSVVTTSEENSQNYTCLCDVAIWCHLSFTSGTILKSELPSCGGHRDNLLSSTPCGKCPCSCHSTTRSAAAGYNGTAIMRFMLRLSVPC